jgi:hypothetical protein
VALYTDAGLLQKSTTSPAYTHSRDQYISAFAYRLGINSVRNGQYIYFSAAGSNMGASSCELLSPSPLPPRRVLKQITATARTQACAAAAVVARQHIWSTCMPCMWVPFSLSQSMWLLPDSRASWFEIEVDFREMAGRRLAWRWRWRWQIKIEIYIHINSKARRLGLGS